METADCDYRIRMAGNENHLRRTAESTAEYFIRLQHTSWSTTTIQTYLARLVKKG